MSTNNPNVPVRRILAQFGYLFPNWSNTTPFTYQDGNTAAKMLESLIAYIDKTLVPYVDDEMNSVIASWEETVTALIEAITDNAIDLQDDVLAGILANTSSASRIFLETLLSNILTPRAGNPGEWALRGATGQVWFPVSVNAAGDFPTRIETVLANKFADKDDVYTKTEGDNRYAPKSDSYTRAQLYTRTEADNKFATNLEFDALDNDVTALETLVATGGRLSQGNMDVDYVRVIKNQHAVFIGSSNSAAGYGWTQALCAKRGWIHHNYAIGGGAFVPLDGVNNFRQQVNTAIADTSFPKADVRWVFITDMSNDIRGLNNVESASLQVISQLRTAYPNARIIIVPVVWTYVQDNYNDLDKRVGVRRRYEEVKRSAEVYDAEVIPDTWLWFWDSRNWLEGIAPNFHLNGPGYTRLWKYIEKYIDGKDIDNGIAWTQATQVISVGTLATLINCSRSRGIVTINGSLTSYGAVPVDTVIARLPAGMAPIRQMVVEITNTDRERNALYINDNPSNGDITTMTALPGARSFFFQASYAVL